MALPCVDVGWSVIVSFPGHIQLICMPSLATIGPQAKRYLNGVSSRLIAALAFICLLGWHELTWEPSFY